MSLAFRKQRHSVFFERHFNWLSVVKDTFGTFLCILAHLAAKRDERLETQLISLHNEANSLSRSQPTGRETLKVSFWVFGFVFRLSKNSSEKEQRVD